MKTFRCPWCGEACISPINKSFFYSKGNPKKGNICPACNRQFIPKEGPMFLLIPEILILLLFILLSVKYGQGLLIPAFIYLLSLVFVIYPVIRYFFRPILRCADQGYKPLPIAAPFLIETNKPVRLIQEDIFAVESAQGEHDTVLQGDMANTPIPIHLKASKTKGMYYMGFLHPESIQPDCFKSGTTFKIIVNRREKVLAAIISKV